MTIRRLAAAWCGALLLTIPGLAPAQVPNPEFAEVTAKLDSGGTFYLYTDLEGFLTQIIDEMSPIFEASDQKELALVIPIARSAVKALGLDGLDDLGMSTLPLDAGTARIKTYLRLDPRSGLFNLLGATEPRDLEGLALIPQDAVLAAVENLNLDAILTFLEKGAREVAGGAGEGAVRQALKTIEETHGLNLKDVSASLGDEIGLYARLDAQTSVTLGEDEKTMSIPRPSAALFVRVKNATLFETVIEWLKKSGAEIEKLDGLKDAKGYELSVPENPMKFAPAIAATDKWLIIATDRAEIEAALAAAAKGDLRSSTEFKAARRDLPAKVNGIGYQSPRLTAELLKLLDAVIPEVPDAAARRMFSQVRDKARASAAPAGTISVRVNDPNGFLWITLTGREAASASKPVLAGVAAGGFLVAVAVPAFQKAQEESQAQACQENLSKIHTAKQQWALDHKMGKSAEPDWEDLLEDGKYLKEKPECPAGGEYELNAVGESPTCSLGEENEAHRLPE